MTASPHDAKELEAAGKLLQRSRGPAKAAAAPAQAPTPGAAATPTASLDAKAAPAGGR